MKHLFGICSGLVLLSAVVVYGSERHLVPLRLPAAAATSTAVGHLAPERRLSLVLGLPLRNRETLTNLLAELYDPASPNYHQFLTPTQFAEKFGPTPQQYQAVMDFAKRQHLTITRTHPNRTLLNVSASAADVERAFAVTLRLYPHPKEARTFFAPDIQPSVDASLPLLSVGGLTDYARPHPMSLRASAVGPARGVSPYVGSGPNGSFLGNDFRAAYAPGVALDGSGQTLALLEFDGYYPADIAQYKSLANLPDVPVTNVLLDGFDGSAGSGNNEVALDIEMALAMAPGLSQILVYEDHPVNGNANTPLNQMATDGSANQISSSWGFDGVDANTEQIFQQFAAQGQSYFNASGDDGADIQTVSSPSDDPYVISVGGTALSTSGPAGAWASETTWNVNSAGGGTTASSGGSSPTYTIPSWQQGISMSKNQGSTTTRNFPDVAMTAENVWVVWNNGTTSPFGGTSVAAPLWAAFTALINQQAAANGQPPVGFLNPALYAIAKGPGYLSCFHDITTGNNTTKTSPTNYYAVAGYDLCTGWGTPTGSNLINVLAAPATAPVLKAAGFVLLHETFSPTNGVVDPGETVTLNFALQNLSPISTTNLVATLASNVGVAPVSGPQTYGVITRGGGSVSQPFTFTAAGACGSTVTATLRLQDGSTDLGSVSFTLPLGQPVTPLNERFDQVTAPNLPSGWTTSISGSGARWLTATNPVDSAPNAAYGPESLLPGISELVSPVFTFSSPTAQLTFQQKYFLEENTTNGSPYAFDGGVLEISIGGSAFADILDAGGSFVTGGYTRTIDPTDDNPLPGRRVWSGLSQGFMTTVINLPASAVGQPVRLKWRLATDTANGFGGTGWYIDNVAVIDGYSGCSSSPALTAPTLQLSSFDRSSSTVSFTVPSLAGLHYELQYKDSLNDATWTPLPTIVLGTGSPITLQDTTASANRRFYRVRSY